MWTNVLPESRCLATTEMVLWSSAVAQMANLKSAAHLAQGVLRLGQLGVRA